MNINSWMKSLAKYILFSPASFAKIFKINCIKSIWYERVVHRLNALVCCLLLVATIKAFQGAGKIWVFMTSIPWGLLWQKLYVCISCHFCLKGIHWGAGYIPPTWLLRSSCKNIWWLWYLRNMNLPLTFPLTFFMWHPDSKCFKVVRAAR